MKATIRNMGAAWLLLSLFAIAGTGLVALTYTETHDIIVKNERDALLVNLSALVPATTYDNNVTEDLIAVSDPDLLGTMDPVTIYRARMGQQPVALFATPVAPNGYGGPIRLLVGVYEDGTLAGVRVLSHKETPGLGDAIEVPRSDWILSFTGKSLLSPPESRWTVAKDGGAFDQFTGATITPRAVIKTVHQFLIYFELHRDSLFAGVSPKQVEDKQ